MMCRANSFVYFFVYLFCGLLLLPSVIGIEAEMIIVSLQTIIQAECIIRGDLANIRIGRLCIVGARAVIRPPFKKFSKG